MKSPGTLFVIAAPSGAGKTSLVTELLKTVDDIIVSVSYTTRPKRPSEVEGINYHFVEKAQFDAMVDREEFLEHATVYGNEYGTSKPWVEQQLSEGCDVILEIDWQGAQQIRAKFPHCVTAFILPPAREVLRERLQARAEDELPVIEMRMTLAQGELDHCREFDYLVVNDDFESALSDLKAIICSERLKNHRQQVKFAKLLEDLLENPVINQ